MQIRDRIRELRRVRASQLRPNPRNWRTHPESQREALRGVLAEIGYAGALLACLTKILTKLKEDAKPASRGRKKKPK